VILALGAFAGCGQDHAEAFAAALASGDCAALADGALRDACAVSHGQCALAEAEAARSECAFQRAEREGDPKGCADAGVWADDCRLHLWAASFERWSPPDPTPGRDEALVEAQLPPFAFAADDPRPWSAWYRWVHGHTRPLDRSACAAVADPARAEACRQTGLAHYGDMLNVARDRHVYPCDGGPLPAFLAYTPDAEIDALRARRTDLCPP
jgi:hypothetical protein